MFVSGVRSSWEAFDTKSLLTCANRRSSVTSRRVRRMSTTDSPRYRTVVPEHRTVRLPWRVAMETSCGFGCSPLVHPSMKARAWGWRITSGYGRPAPIVSEVSKIFPASRFIIRTDRSAAMTMTPSSRLASSVSRRALPASSCPIVSSRCDAILFIAFAISSSSSPVRTWARLARLPAPISFAAACISVRGPVIFRAMTAVPARIRRSAANPVPQMIAVICHRRRVRIATGTEARAAPTIVPPIEIGMAAYRCSSRTVMLRRRDTPVVPERASRISGWDAWFSIPGTPAAPTAESATTVPSGRTTVIRPPISFPRRSPSREIRSSSRAGSASIGRNVSATILAWASRFSSASAITRLRTRKKPTAPAIRSAIPAITRCVRKNFAAMERRRAKRRQLSRSL